MHSLVSKIWIRFLGLSYFLAFASLMMQLRGLISSQGILPAVKFLEAVSNNVSASLLGKFFILPSLFWFNSSDKFLFAACFLGIVLSMNLMIRKDKNKFDVFEFISLVVLYLLYLSFVNVSRDFLSFQWDALLLEAGFLSVVYAAFKANAFASRVLAWLFRFLVFKLMLMSGLIKLYTHDATWANLTALNYHYYTQPLPNPISFFIHQLPAGFHKFSCMLMFFIELIVPFFIFTGRSLRRVAALAFIALQLAIMFTGNYCFFNLLTIFLCLWLLDDALLARLLPEDLVSKLQDISIVYNSEQMFHRQINNQLASLDSHNLTRTMLKTSVVALAVLFITVDAYFIVIRSPLDLSRAQASLRPLDALVLPLLRFHMNSPYGLFATMTTVRNEIVIQGANDIPGQFGMTDWQDYEFYFKPQDLKALPKQVAPYQPRLDWQMWFAALSSVDQQPWFVNFCVRLLQGDQAVLRLLKHNPYPDHPPKYLRALLYEYKFNDLETYYRTGEYWSREYRRVYMPDINLQANES